MADSHRRGVRLTAAQWDDVLTAKRRHLATEKALLDEAVQTACPGEHQPAQHRDGRAPWCRACGRTQDGRRVVSPEQLKGL